MAKQLTNFLSLFTFLCFALSLQACADVKPKANKVKPKTDSQKSKNLEPYRSQDGIFSLSMPKGWKINSRNTENTIVLLIKDQAGISFVDFLATTVDKNMDSVELAKKVLSDLKLPNKGFKINLAATLKDHKMTTMDFNYVNSKNIVIRNRYYFSVDGNCALVKGYGTAFTDFDKKKPILLSILNKIKLMEQKPDVTLLKPKPDTKNLPDEPFQFDTVSYNAQDNSCSIIMPKGWKAAGGKGRIIVTSQDGGTGFTFFVSDFIGEGSIPYLDSSKLPGNHLSYCGPTKAMAHVLKLFGSSNVRSLERYNDDVKANQISRMINRNSEAEYSVLTYTNSNGINCKGFFDIINLKPLYSGQWCTIYAGIWAPASQFERYILSLIDMWESFEINEAWAREYIKQGLANLKRLMAKTIAMARNNAEEIRKMNLSVFEEKGKSGDYINYIRSKVILGQQDFINGMEGSPIYSTDGQGLSKDGVRIAEGQHVDYPNFNPSDLIKIDSRDIYEGVFKK